MLNTLTDFIPMLYIKNISKSQIETIPRQVSQLPKSMCFLSIVWCDITFNVYCVFNFIHSLLRTRLIWFFFAFFFIAAFSNVQVDSFNALHIFGSRIHKSNRIKSNQSQSSLIYVGSIDQLTTTSMNNENKGKKTVHFFQKDETRF